jgi:hypothetical protein
MEYSTNINHIKVIDITIQIKYILHDFVSVIEPSVTEKDALESN